MWELTLQKVRRCRDTCGMWPAANCMYGLSRAGGFVFRHRAAGRWLMKWCHSRGVQFLLAAMLSQPYKMVVARSGVTGTNQAECTLCVCVSVCVCVCVCVCVRPTHRHTIASVVVSGIWVIWGSLDQYCFFYRDARGRKYSIIHPVSLIIEFLSVLTPEGGGSKYFQHLFSHKTVNCVVIYWRTWTIWFIMAQTCVCFLQRYSFVVPFFSAWIFIVRDHIRSSEAAGNVHYVCDDSYVVFTVEHWVKAVFTTGFYLIKLKH